MFLGGIAVIRPGKFGVLFAANGFDMINESRWDFSTDRMRHCGSSLCNDWANKEDENTLKAIKIMDRRYQEVIKRLKKGGLCS